MSDTAILVEGLGKRYRIGLEEEVQDTLGGAAMAWAKAPVKNFRNLRRLKSFDDPEAADVIWALRDVDFEVKRGEVVGVIGRNGAGKSTLLKLLSRITEPSEGRAVINGRVSSLLEVGTGFHPELTGRENVYLNGSILGMRKREIDAKFDEIVAFAEISKFIDTPVKRYSSGMKVRLAFSVAAHLEPEILLIDEVLAVGDVAFQKKCLGKMGSVVQEGRTVLFVSHHMAAVRNLCERTICFEQGRLVVDTDTDKAIAYYLDQNLIDKADVTAEEMEERMEGVILRDDPTIRLRGLRLHAADGTPRQTFHSDEEVGITVRYACLKPVQDLRVVVQVVDEEDTTFVATQNLDDPQAIANFHQMETGEYEATVRIPGDTFGERRFFVTLQLINPKTEHLRVHKVLSFDVRFKGYNNVQYGSFGKSVFRPQLPWTIHPLSVTSPESYA